MQCKKCQEKYPNKLHQGICKLCWSKIGKKSKRKGARNEREGGAKFYEKEFGITVRRTPRSGGFGSFMPGDIMARGETILNDFYIYSARSLCKNNERIGRIQKKRFAKVDGSPKLITKQQTYGRRKKFERRSSPRRRRARRERW